jgi:hypothetical protein
MKKFLQSANGKLIISIILGFGLSTLFRKSCSEKSCIEFKSPPLDKILNQIYKYDNKCYTFKPHHSKCSPTKKTIQFA